MIQVKAICKFCMGTGYAITSEYHNIPVLCPDCNGKGVLILTAETWDIELEYVPNSIMEEMGVTI